MIPNSSNWGERASKAVSAHCNPKRDYDAEMDPAGSIIGSPVSKQDWGGFQKGGWPIKPIPEEYRKLRYSDVETLLVNGSIDFATPAESAKKLLPYLFPAIVAYIIALFLPVFGLAGILRSVRKK